MRARAGSARPPRPSALGGIGAARLLHAVARAAWPPRLLALGGIAHASRAQGPLAALAFAVVKPAPRVGRLSEVLGEGPGHSYSIAAARRRAGLPSQRMRCLLALSP
eukprot:3698640-Lingulodinium_polyedra.AAC.1